MPFILPQPLPPSSLFPLPPVAKTSVLNSRTSLLFVDRYESASSTFRYALSRDRYPLLGISEQAPPDQLGLARTIEGYHFVEDLKGSSDEPRRMRQGSTTPLAIDGPAYENRLGKSEARTEAHRAGLSPIGWKTRCFMAMAALLGLGSMTLLGFSICSRFLPLSFSPLRSPSSPPFPSAVALHSSNTFPTSEDLSAISSISEPRRRRRRARRKKNEQTERDDDADDCEEEEEGCQERAGIAKGHAGDLDMGPTTEEGSAIFSSTATPREATFQEGLIVSSELLGELIA